MYLYTGSVKQLNICHTFMRYKMFINKATILNLNRFNCCLYYNVINIRHTSTKRNSFEDKILRKQLVQKHLDLNYNQAAGLLRNNPYLQTIDVSKLEDTLYTLNKFGIKNEDIVQNPLTLSLHYNTVEHNVMYLQEAGFENISAQFLLRFRNIVKKPVALLKAHGVISESISVQNRLFSYLIPKPLQFPLLEKLNDEDSIVHMHEQIFKHYLVWRLDTEEQNINRIFKTYDKFKYRSFQLMSEMIKLLTRELKFTKQKILRQSYLFQTNPQYPLQLLRLFPKIADTDIKDILFKHPKIIAVPPESITAIINHLKKFGVSDESLQNCFEIFTLCPDTVLYRLKQAEQIPEFEALKHNKRFVRLLFNFNKAKLRLDLLHNAKVKSSSINLLVASENTFEKYAFEGYDTNRGADIINYLADVLSIEVLELRKRLSQNPHWCQVPLVNIQDTLKFLKTRQFPNEEIRRLPVILLYSRNIIKQAFDDIQSHPELHKLILNRRELLNLCLYFVEIKYHFSGDGVWEDKTLTKKEHNDEILEDLPVVQPETTEETKSQTLC